VSVRFDDPNLVSCAGLATVLALATGCGLATLLTERLRIEATGGANATAKVLALVAGMVVGADSITNMDLLRHGGMTRLFEQVGAPSTLGTFLRLFANGTQTVIACHGLLGWSSVSRGFGGGFFDVWGWLGSDGPGAAEAGP
jgi:hypothetical protein